MEDSFYLQRCTCVYSDGNWPIESFSGHIHNGIVHWKTIFTAYKCAMSGFEDKIYNGGLFICVKPLYKCFAWRLPVLIQSWPGFSSALMTSYNNLLLNLSL